MAKNSEQLFPVTPNLEEIAQASEQSMQTVMKSYNAWWRTAGEVQAEMLQFVNNRLSKDMEIPTRLAECKNPTDVAEQQMAFANTMLKDYADEGQRILDLMNKTAAEIK